MICISHAQQINFKKSSESLSKLHSLRDYQFLFLSTVKNDS